MNDLEQARKMLEMAGTGVPVCEVQMVSSDTYRATLAFWECDTPTVRLEALHDDPLTAARRAIEMYRLIKYGPEVVEVLRRIRSLLESVSQDALGCSVDSRTGEPEYPYRDEAIDRINIALAHLLQETPHDNV